RRMQSLLCFHSYCESGGARLRWQLIKPLQSWPKNKTKVANRLGLIGNRKRNCEETVGLAPSVLSKDGSSSPFLDVNFMRQNRFCFNITSRPVDPTNYLFVRVLVLTGAGVSAESGIPTFRGKEGYWRNLDPAKLATSEAFQNDPKLVWEWYRERRERIRAAQPNPAH